MRLYTFTNYYLSSLQIGLQSAHVTSELFVKYPYDRYVSSLAFLQPKAAQLYDWAINHKTMIYLNGGNQQSLFDIVEFFNTMHNDFPWASCSEDEQSLNSCLTCVGIVLPDYIYENAAYLRTKRMIPEIDPIEQKINIIRNESPFQFNATRYEIELMDKINSYSLAR